MPNKSPKEEKKCKLEGQILSCYCGTEKCLDSSIREPMPHPTQDKIIEQKLKELKEMDICCYACDGYECNNNNRSKPKLESFLSQALTESYLAGREEGSINEAEFHETACQNLLLEIIEKMPKVKISLGEQAGCVQEDDEYTLGFNKCRDIFLSLISEMKK